MPPVRERLPVPRVDDDLVLADERADPVEDLARVDVDLSPLPAAVDLAAPVDREPEPRDEVPDDLAPPRVDVDLDELVLDELDFAARGLSTSEYAAAKEPWFDAVHDRVTAFAAHSPG